MSNKLIIDNNILLFDNEENNQLYIQLNQNNNTIISKMLSYEFVEFQVTLYFENHISLIIKKINNNVSKYQLFLNIITYQDFIKREFIQKCKPKINILLHKIWIIMQNYYTLI